MFNFSYIGMAVGLGLVLYGKRKSYARHVVQLAVGLYMLLETLEQGMNVCFGTAGVPTADEMDDFHIRPPKRLAIRQGMG